MSIVGRVPAASAVCLPPPPPGGLSCITEREIILQYFLKKFKKALLQGIGGRSFCTWGSSRPFPTSDRGRGEGGGVRDPPPGTQIFLSLRINFWSTFCLIFDFRLARNAKQKNKITFGSFWYLSKTLSIWGGYGIK